MDNRGRLAPTVFPVAKAARRFPLSVIISCSFSWKYHMTARVNPNLYVFWPLEGPQKIHEVISGKN